MLGSHDVLNFHEAEHRSKPQEMLPNELAVHGDGDIFPFLKLFRSAPCRSRALCDSDSAFRVSPDASEELGELLATQIAQAAFDLDAVIEARIFEHGIKGSHRAALGIDRPENDTRDAGGKDGASAHGTGLEGDEE